MIIDIAHTENDKMYKAIQRTLREMAESDARSRLDRLEWQNRIWHTQRAHQLTQRRIVLTIRDLRTKQK